ncbi:hypothetical protein ACFW9D_05650 [Streptomyces sp. NPDC059524]|uniref:hypothetical protein n=1 Tax=Streptomyces sp. NPDC059524 TaxID=3346856 RepID=UPI00368B94F9
MPGPTGPAGTDATGIPGQDGADGSNGSDGTDGSPPAEWTYTDPDGVRYRCTPVDDFDPAQPRYGCAPTSTPPPDDPTTTPDPDQSDNRGSSASPGLLPLNERRRS